MKNSILMLTILLLLQSCVFIAGAAAGAAAIAIVYDHRTLEKTLDDQKMANGIAKKINANTLLKANSHIDVTSFNHVVLLTGQTTTKVWRDKANIIASKYQGVSKVYNDITVKGPTSSLTRASDSWITTKIKTQMLAATNLKSSSIKVLTENGTVYLMGIVSKEQANAAVNIARQVSGVQKVIKIFQYTN